MAALPAVTAVLYAAALVVAFYVALRDDALARGARGAQRRVEAKVRELAIILPEFASSGNLERATSAARTLAALEDGLTAIEDVVPAALAEVAEARRMLAAVGAAAQKVISAPARPQRIEALAAFFGPLEQLEARIEAIEDRVGAEADALHRATLLFLVGAATLHIALVAAVWTIHRKRSRDVSERRRKAAAEAFEAVTRHLRAAREGRAVTPLPAGAEVLGPLEPEIRAVVEALDEERRAHERERRAYAHRHALAEELEVADDAGQVAQAVATAVRAGVPGAGFQLLLADDARSALAPQLADGAHVCAPGEQLACPAARRGRLVSSAPGAARCPHVTADRPVTCSVVPICGRAVGVAQVVGAADEGAVEALGAFALAAGARLTVIRTLEEREAIAAVDPLTGLANRRGLQVRLAQLERSGEPYGVVCADLDHFKRLNDDHGHPAGDECLKTFARVLRETCRTGDLIVRQGGEEFAVILPGTTVEGARVIAERIRQGLVDATRDSVPFTASFGVAGRPEIASTAVEALAAADAALYVAKERGRNRVEVSDGHVARALSGAPGRAACP